jgi:hypothetical protein
MDAFALPARANRDTTALMKRAFWAALLTVVCITAFVQYQAIRKQQTEAERLRAELATLQSAQAEAEKASVTDTNELARLRTENAELVRLRGQVAELRRDLKAAQQAAASRAAAAAANAVAMTNAPANEPVRKFVANIQATVPPQQTLVAGGWKLPSGKHALFFIEPVIGEASGDSGSQILVQARIIELPDEALSRHGLAGLKSEGTEAGGQMLLSASQLKDVMDALKQEEGASILTAPRLLSLSGRQAQIKIADSHSLPSGETFETGPVLDLVPTVAADGQSIDMRISAQIRVLDMP